MTVAVTPKRHGWALKLAPQAYLYTHSQWILLIGHRFPPKMSNTISEQVSLFRSCILHRRSPASPTLPAASIFFCWFGFASETIQVLQTGRRDAANSRISFGLQGRELVGGSPFEPPRVHEVWISLYHPRNRRETCRSEASGSGISCPSFRSYWRCWGTSSTYRTCVGVRLCVYFIIRVTDFAFGTLVQIGEYDVHQLRPWLLIVAYWFGSFNFRAEKQKKKKE